ncbi:dephospho-CoA kinase [Pseudothermotoga sp. U03pept]|uniref:dephospho-CoA kinase n=1 Tax=Pseudothermotoga sp. U03pept TaxID=3447012 RepID=UPI003F01838E
MVVGLTGRIGSGKSTAAEIFKELGAHVIDVDRIGHEVLQMQEVKNSLRKIFGDEIFDGLEINRKKLASRAFSNSTELQLLERVVHPLIRERVKKQIDLLDGLIIIDAAILHRLGLDELCDLVVTIVAPFEKIIQRLRDKGLSEEEINKRLSAQQDIPECGTVIENDSDLDSLCEKIKSFYTRVIKSKLYG